MYKPLLTLALLANLFSNLNGISIDKDKVINALVDVANAKKDFINNLTGPPFVVAQIISNVANRISTDKEKVINALVDIANAKKDFINNLTGPPFVVAQIISNVANRISTDKEKVINALVDIANAKKDFINNLTGPPFVVAQIISSVANRISTDKEKVINALVDVANVKKDFIKNLTGPPFIIAQIISSEANKQCGLYEKYTTCPEYLCLPQICAHVGFPQCTSHEERYYYLKETGKKCDGPPSCVCIENYVRNEKGICISVHECPSCGHDKNATVGCGLNCRRRCSNYLKKDVACPDVCYVNRCDCKDGYVFDDYTGLCVLPNDCSKPNGEATKSSNEMNDSSSSNANKEKSSSDSNSSQSCDNCNVDCDSELDGAKKWKNQNDMELSNQNQCKSQDTEMSKHHKSRDSEKTSKRKHSKEDNDNEYTCKKDANKTRKSVSADDAKERSKASAKSCKGDPNARPGCDEECLKRCRGDEPKKCKCPKDSCECNPGYLYNSKMKKCTKPDQCDANTKQKSVNADDANATSNTSSKSCKGDQHAKPGCDKNCEKRCPGDKSKKCKCPTDSCECKTGYVYNSKMSKCTKPDKCDTKNEKNDDKIKSISSDDADATTKTTTKSCKSDENAKPGCDKECVKRCPGDKSKKCKCPTDSCECKTGYVYNSKMSKCITPDKCVMANIIAKSLKSHKNEVKTKSDSTTSTTSCKEDQNGYDKECKKRCPGDETKVCKCPADSCKCKPGFFYNSKTDKCIKPDKCGKATMTATTTAGENKSTSSNSVRKEATQNMDPSCGRNALSAYIKGNIGFTAKLLHEVNQENYGRSLVIGGSSILYLLGQLQLFASKSTSDQIQATMGINKNQVKCLLPELYENLTTATSSVDYDMATVIIGDKNCSFTYKFTKGLKETFNTAPVQYDFNNPLSARMIDDMIAMHTNNHVKDYMTSNVLSSFTNLILVDAQSFRGDLSNKFKAKDTTEMDFHGDNGRITKKPMMFQTGKFLYTNCLFLMSKVIKMFYKGDEFSLVIFLPHFANGVPDLMKKLSSPDHLLKALSKLRTENVDVYLPRLKVSSATRLKYATEKANVDKIFNTKSAGLQCIANCTDPFVSGILQKITFMVDENEEGSNNYNIPEFSSKEVDPNNNNDLHIRRDFKADHPFLFYLFNKDIVLFAGVYFY